MIPVVEIFGPTLQGEGPAAGRNAVFLRLGGCNLSCSWCDTPYSWDGSRFDLRKEITPMTIEEILQALPAAEIVVVTGGEPLLHQRNPLWAQLMTQLKVRYSVHLETNGTIAPFAITRACCDLIAVSPKMPHAGDHHGRNPAPWSGWPSVPAAFLKVVAQTPDDVVGAAASAQAWGWARDRTWVMPEGQTTDEVGGRWPTIAGAAAALGINASHRLHLLAWADERGH